MASPSKEVTTFYEINGILEAIIKKYDSDKGEAGTPVNDLFLILCGLKIINTSFISSELVSYEHGSTESKQLLKKVKMDITMVSIEAALICGDTLAEARREQANLDKK